MLRDNCGWCDCGGGILFNSVSLSSIVSLLLLFLAGVAVAAAVAEDTDDACNNPSIVGRIVSHVRFMGLVMILICDEEEEDEDEDDTKWGTKYSANRWDCCIPKVDNPGSAVRCVSIYSSHCFTLNDDDDDDFLSPSPLLLLLPVLP